MSSRSEFLKDNKKSSWCDQERNSLERVSPLRPLTVISLCLTVAAWHRMFVVIRKFMLIVMRQHFASLIEYLQLFHKVPMCASFSLSFCVFCTFPSSSHDSESEIRASAKKCTENWNYGGIWKHERILSLLYIQIAVDSREIFAIFKEIPFLMLISC